MSSGPGAGDPFEVLGLDRTSSAGEVRRARRRLAKRLHPDRGGDATTMQAINAAADAALTALRVPAPPDPASTDPTSPQPSGSRWQRVATDTPSFTVEALPVESFEALVIVANWMGEVLVDEPPYVLETHLVEPFDCWCRLDIVPDAGASTVSIVIAAPGERPLPDVDAVRDAWVANLNRLDWDQVGPPPS